MEKTMKRNTSSFTRITAGLLAFILSFGTFFMDGIITAEAAVGAKYYVSFESGDDGNTGTSEGQAWKTFANVNAKIFNPGDQILLDRASVWEGQLAPKGSGTAQAPIIIDAYGNGETKPRINARNMEWDASFNYNEDIPVNETRQWNAAVVLYNQQYWEINNIEVTNFSPNLKTYRTYTANNDTVGTVNKIPSRYGILVVGKDAGVLRHIYIKNTFVHGINATYTNAAGIGRGGIVYLIRGNDLPTRWDDIIISDNRVGDRNDFANGLKVAPEQPSVGHYGVVFHGSYVGGSGIFPYESGIPASERRAGAAYSTNIVVRNNYFQDVGNAVICFGAVENGVAEYNISDHCNSGLNGNVPIWWHDTKHVVAQYNEIFDSGASTSKEDSQAFDADINAKYNIVQYNYTHDNPSGSFFECDSGTEYVSHFRYNVSVNDGYGNNSHGNGAVVTLQSSSNQNSKMYIYNNDFYIGEGKTSLIGNHWGGTNAHKPHYVTNNFIYDNGLGNGTSSNSGISGAPGIAYESRFFNSTNFDNNYYGGARAEKIVASTDKNPVTGGDVAIANLDANIARDLTGLTGWEKLQDFTRGAASVLKGSGAALPQLGEANSINDFTPNGGLDIMGNPVSPFNKPSIGAYEVGADLSVPEDKKVIDFETAVSDVKLTGANWRTADNGNFGKELYWNTAATDARQTEIIIPAGYTFYGFTARTANSAKITVDFNGQSKAFYATSAKNSFTTDFMALPALDTPVRISIASPWGVNGVFLDNLIISNTPPKTNDIDKGENILPGKAVTQSSGSEAAANGNDNDIVTVAGKSTLDGDNYTWQADLGQTHDLSFVEVEWPADFGTNDWKYKIEYSMDSVNWGVLADYTQSNPNTALLQERSLDHLNARYLRLIITGLPSGQTGEAYFGEFRAYGKPIGAAVENLALNKPSTVSAGYNPARTGNDGDKTTFSGNNGNPITWTVDLEDLYNVTQIAVSHEPGRNDDIILDWKYVLEYSEDGSTWAEVPFASSNGNQTVKPTTANYSTVANNPWSSGVSPADSVTQATGTDVNARYLRMRFTGKPTQPTDFWYVLYEFEVFGGEINAAAENVALKKVATVSPGSNAQYGNDGSKDSPFAGNNGNPITWTVNLDGLYDISKIGIYHEPKRAAAEVLDWKYVLEYSVDGNVWAAVPFLSSNGNPEITPETATYSSAANHPWATGVAGADSVEQITNTEIAARHLRIRFTGKPSVSTMGTAWYGLWEFEAYGTPVVDNDINYPSVSGGAYAYQNQSLNGRPEALPDPIFAGKQLNVASPGLTGRAANANDGNAATYAGNTNLDENNKEYWLAVDLGAAYNAYGFEVDWGTGKADWLYKIQSSMDGKTWTDVPGADYTQSGFMVETRAAQITNEINALGQFFRVVVTDDNVISDEPVRLGEFKVFGIYHSTPNENIALNKPASGTLANPQFAVDGGKNEVISWAGRTADGQPWGLHGEGQKSVDLIVDLGAVYDVDEVQLEFEDMNLVPNYNFLSHDALVASANVGTAGYASRANTGKNHAEAVKYSVEYSLDNSNWSTLWDYSKVNPAVPVEIRKEIVDGDLEDIYDNNASVRQGFNYAPWLYETNDAESIEARYIRVTLKGAPAERRMTQYVLSELRAFGEFNRNSDPAPAPVDNIAFGKPVLAIGGNTTDQLSAAVVTDGKNNTQWTANGDALRIDLGLGYNIDDVIITATEDNIKVSVSDQPSENVDDAVWTPFEGTAQGRYLLVEAPESAIITKIEVTGSEVPSAEKKTVMILGAHPDDESLMTAGVIRRAVENGDDVYVLLGTLGDYNGTGSTGSGGQARMKETINAMQVLGVPASNIYFLAFADTGGLDEFGMSGTGNYYAGSFLYRLFTAEDADQVFTSRQGATTTYGGVQPSYHNRFFGEENTYTRNGFLFDIKDAIKRVNPDDIYTTGRYDLHGDHAAIGLFANEAVIDLRADNPEFNPVMHETFIHSCAHDTVGSTQWPILNSDGTGIQPFEMPQGLEEKTIYDWHLRESITVPDAMRVTPFSANLKTEALNQYTSQVSAWIRSFAKFDEIFWTRDYDNIAFLADVSASSEKSETQAAGKTIDGIRDGESDAMNDSPYIRPDHPNRYPFAEWVSDSLANEWLKLDWGGDTYDISEITLYDRPDTTQQITAGEITFLDDEDNVVETIAVGALPQDGRPMTISLETPVTADTIIFSISDAEGTNAGLAEIEVKGTENTEITKTVANYEIKNDTTDPVTVQCILAVYDERGRLVSIKTEIATINPDDTFETALKTDYNPDYTAKAFIWDSNFVPLCGAVTWDGSNDDFRIDLTISE